MDLMNIRDISCVDFDELGVRPLNSTNEINEIDFDDGTHGYFGKGKQIDLYSKTNGQNFIINDDDSSMSDGDDANYDIDPETGEKIFRGLLVSSSPLFSVSNVSWIEEYLTNIESSSSSSPSSSSSNNQLLPTRDLLFEDISLSKEQTDSDWFSSYISTDEPTHHIMFHDQYLSDQLNTRNLPQTESPVSIPLSNKNTQNSLINLFNVGIDDEHSICIDNENTRKHRLYSSVESDSNTHDSELTLDGSYIETKLEKLEYDEHTISHTLLRRTSTRGNIQGQHDEDTLRRYNIPLTVNDITQSTTDEYNRHLAQLHYLSAEQIHIIKDIRRRGKNKIAAQNCRKRKANNVETLVEEVDELKKLKNELEERKRLYQNQITETRNQYEFLHRQVLPDRQLPPAIIVK